MCEGSKEANTWLWARKLIAANFHYSVRELNNGSWQLWKTKKLEIDKICLKNVFSNKLWWSSCWQQTSHEVLSGFLFVFNSQASL